MAVDSAVSNKIANMGIFCALLVLFIHLPLGGGAGMPLVRNWIPCGIAKIAVPFFFVASGYLLAGRFDEEGWYKKAVLKRLRTLYLPMVLWGVLYYYFCRIGLTFVRNILSDRDCFADLAFSTLYPGFENLLRMFALHPFEEPYLGVMWFVRMVFVLVLFAPLLKKISVPAVIGVLYLLQAFTGPDLGGTPPPLEFTLLKGFFPVCGAAAFCCGIMLRTRHCNLAVKKQYGIMFTIAGLLMVYFQGTDFCMIKPQYVSWVYIPVLIVGVWSLCPEKRLPSFLVTASFPVYVLHMFVRNFARAIMPGHINSMDALFYFIFGFACFAACIAIAWLMRKLLPRTSAVLFGGR